MERGILKSKISELHYNLQTMEDLDPLYTKDRLKRLRDRVWYVSERMEENLDHFLLYGVYGFVKNMTVVQNALGIVKINELLNGFTFGGKIRIAKDELKVLKGNLKGEYKIVNKIRNQFAHPKSYQNELKYYTTDEGEFEVLTKLKKAMDTLNDFYRGNVK